MYNYLLGLGHAEGWEMLSDKVGNLYAVKGKAESYPCAVAHMDTVHRIEKGGILPIVVQGKIFGLNPQTMRQTGIGGDDKCGIWAALHCMRALPVCKAVFFVDEENGCRGSGSCDLTFFKDCRYILQADRRGNNDFVNRISGGDLSSDEFQEAVALIIKRFGYRHSWGAMTDVMQLRDDNVGISAANMSAGYHNPHSDDEYIVVEELSRVCEMMEIIFREVTDTYPYTYVPKPVAFVPAGKAGGGGYGHVADKDDPFYVPWPDDATPADGGVPEHSGSTWKPVHCSFCSAKVYRNDLIEEDPPVCIDCALFKEEHGFYPVSDIGGMWRRLQGLQGKFGGKRKRKKWKGIKGGNGTHKHSAIEKIAHHQPMPPTPPAAK